MTNQAEIFELEIPFHGFYESIHVDAIDDMVDLLAFDENEENYDQSFVDSINYRDIFTDYAKQYCEAFKEETGLNSLTFKKLVSPREYNFSTDTIEVTINKSDLATIYLYSAEYKKEWATFIKKRCTSRGGFNSFYSNDINSSQWQCLVSNWDFAQLSLLLEFYVSNSISDNIDIDLLDKIEINI